MLKTHTHTHTHTERERERERIKREEVTLLKERITAMTSRKYAHTF